VHPPPRAMPPQSPIEGPPGSPGAEERVQQLAAEVHRLAEV